MESSIAKITIDHKSRQITSINHHGGKIRFKCQRCAVFCCKLGSPSLSKTDVERLRLAVNDVERFLDEKHLNLFRRGDGSCIILSFDSQAPLHKCSVYDSRPALRRLYPFEFQKVTDNSYLLKLITCYNGLNAKGGTVIDTKFVAELVESLLFELVDSGLVICPLLGNRNFEMQT